MVTHTAWKSTKKAMFGNVISNISLLCAEQEIYKKASYIAESNPKDGMMKIKRLDELFGIKQLLRL
jgi:hypothetical protein